MACLFKMSMNIIRNVCKPSLFFTKTSSERLFNNAFLNDLFEKFYMTYKSSDFHFARNLYQPSDISIEAVAQRCSVKQVFLEISQNSQESNSARVSFLIKLQDKTSKNTFSYRTAPVAASISNKKLRIN